MIAFNNTKVLIPGKINDTANLTIAYMPATSFFSLHKNKRNVTKILCQRATENNHHV